MKGNGYCDFCQTKLAEPLYIPVGSKRFMGVYQCSQCRLVQSQPLRDYERDPTRTLSCDADWGNVRHGKGARFQAVSTWLTGLPFGDYAAVLDVGANRGDFVLWAKAAHPHLDIRGVEPDGSVTDSYAGVDGIQLEVGRFEHYSGDPVDFIYNVHTLEHASSAIGMLRQCRDLLRDGGHMLLEIPNLAVLADSENVEEYFIDKHTFHFSRGTLRRLCQAAGFRIERENDSNDIHNITLLLSPGDSVDTGHPTEDWQAAIAEYDRIMTSNREQLQRVVQDKLLPLASRQKLGFWGAGRIFNAMVKYGGLGAEQVHCLVDQHLWEIIDNNAGIPISRPEALKTAEPDVVVVLARSSASIIESRVRAMGFRHVLTLPTLLAQV